MKQSIYDPKVRQALFKRIDSVTPETKGRWGKLTATQMIRHLTEANRMALGEIAMPDRSTLLTRTVFKWMFLRNVKPPGREKGQIKTFPEVDVVQSGMPVQDMDTEKNQYKAIVERIANASSLSPTHTAFGKMSRDDWGYLAYAHADYHLTQFNR